MAMRNVILMLLLLAVVSNSVAWAGNFEDGVAAYKRQDYKAALIAMRDVAQQGHASAQYNLALMYGNGQGVPQDYAEAAKWYRLAAQQGYVLAQYNLGVMYANGQGVPQDFAEAVKWYKLAAEQGDVLAQYNLGEMHEKGHGVPKGL